jgi:hypothetical protein
MLWHGLYVYSNHSKGSLSWLQSFDAATRTIPSIWLQNLIRYMRSKAMCVQYRTHRWSSVDSRRRTLPEIYGKVETFNKSLSIDCCVRCVGCCGTELITI